MEKNTVNRIMSLGSEWLASVSIKINSNNKNDTRKGSVDSTSPLVLSIQHPADQTDEAEEKNTNHLNEMTSLTESFICPDYSQLNTSRHQFIKKIPRSSAEERQKWVAHDVTAGKEIILQKVDTETLQSPYLRSGRFGNIPGYGEKWGMNRALFREVVLLRCARKCPFVLACQGFVLDNKMNLYISTEYFFGETLKTHQANHPEKIVAVMKSTSQQILKALDFLHSNKIVHNEVTNANILLRHNTDDGTSSRATGDYQIKISNFTKARDFGVGIPQTDHYRCPKCHIKAYQSHPSFDMLCFGYLLFACLQEGSHPWITSCQCDKDYRKHCRKMGSYLEIGEDAGEFQTEDQRQNQNKLHQTTTYRRRSIRLKMRRHCKTYARSTNERDQAGDRSRLWKDFSSRFSRCLALLLSPCIDDRPSAGVLLRGEYLSLFSGADSVLHWKKKGLAKHISSVSCVTVQDKVDQD